MDFNQRLEKLQQLVQASGGIIEGSKKLQKLAYICQQAGEPLGHSFVFHHYGVFSGSLAGDVQTGYSMGLLDLRGGTSTVVIRFPEQAPRPEVPQTRGFKLVERLKDEEARLLEVLTTILYLSNNGYSGTDLMEKLQALKGQHAQFFTTAQKLAREEFNIDATSASATAARA